MAKSIAPIWQLNSSDPAAAADALVALQLLRCVRALPGQLPARCHDDVGSALAPVIDTLASGLKRRLAGAIDECSIRRAARCKVRVHEADEPFEATEHPEAIAEALNRDRPGLRVVFDAAQRALSRFVHAHPHPASRQVSILAEQLRLSTAERAFLDLAAALCLSTLGRDLFGFVNTPMRLRRVQAQVFGGDADVMPTRPSPILHEAGVLEFGGWLGQRQDLEDLLKLTGVGERLMCTPVESPQAMAAQVLRPLPEAGTAPSLHWPHLAQVHAVARAALQGALDDQVRGFNMLVHGAPGTGKTAFVRQLVQGLGVQGYFVDHADEDGQEASRGDRLASLALCQNFTRGRQRVVMVLDEAEDVFPTIASGARRNSRAPGSKAWLNHLLEQNRHPVVWISNRVDQIDEASLRRFALCVGFPQTPYPMRREMAEQRLAPLSVSPAMIERCAASQMMSPALLDTAARLVTLAHRSAPLDAAPSADIVVGAVLAGHAAATGREAVRRVARPVLPFDPAFLRLANGLDLQAVLGSMRDDAGASLLFHGPPGTGKTQFAAELAQRLGRRIVVHTASDINSQWYGQSEANVARMFAECDPRNEVLLLDEADVLLGARTAGSHRADRAVTAEFLRWLECFEGAFICATNHPECFDAALQRRFVLRVGFLPLDAEQRVALLAKLVAAQAEGGADHAATATLTIAQMVCARELDGLTAGDYANVARRLRRQSVGASDWLHELSLELKAKPTHGRSRIGFV